MLTLTKTTLVVGAALLLAGCTFGASSTTTAPQDGSIAVVLDEYSFAPQSVMLTANQANLLSVSNQGSITHTFVVPELGIDLRVAPGATESTTVTPTEVGSFELTCTELGHDDLGMHGTVTVQ